MEQPWCITLCKLICRGMDEYNCFQGKNKLFVCCLKGDFIMFLKIRFMPFMNEKWFCNTLKILENGF